DLSELGAVPPVAQDLVHVGALTELVAGGHLGLLVLVVGAAVVAAGAVGACHRGGLGRDLGRRRPGREGGPGEHDGLGVAGGGSGGVGEGCASTDCGGGRHQNRQSGDDGENGA